MDQFPGHKCQLNLGSKTYLPKILPTAPLWQKLLRGFQKSLIVSNKNPITSRYFKSQGAIARENRRQAKLPYLVIHPCSHFLLVWRIISLINFGVILFLIPPYIAYYGRLINLGIYGLIIHITITIIMYIEIVTKLFSGYYDKANEKFVLYRREIQMRYLKTTLIPDIISAFPALLLMRMSSNHGTAEMINLYIAFFRYLLCFLNIPKYREYFRIITVYYDFTARTYLMIQLGLSSLYTIHFISLLSMIIPAMGTFMEKKTDTYSIALISNQTVTVDNTNEINKEVEHSALYDYAKAVLITLDAFISSGYKSFSTIRNIYDQYLYTTVILFGWICRAFFIILLMQMLMSHDRSAVLYDGLMRDVKEYCAKFKWSAELTKNIHKYIEYKFRNNYFNEDRILRTLSSRLILQITMDQCKQLVEEVDIFQNLPTSMLKNIMSCLKLEIYLPGEYIIRAADVGTGMYFLETGSAEVVSKESKVLSYLEDGSSFGEVSLLMDNEPQTVSVIAIELCEVYTLSKTDFLNVIKSNSELLAQMQQIILQRIQLISESV